VPAESRGEHIESVLVISNHSRLGPRRLWRRVKLIWKILVATLFSVSTAVTRFRLWRCLIRPAIVVEPISVPKKLADENGYTPDVVARQLRDDIRHIIEAEKTKMRMPELALQRDAPDVVVPSAGLSVTTIANSIQTFLSSERRRNVSGEITARENQLFLRLRLNGRDFYTSPAFDSLAMPSYQNGIFGQKLKADTMPIRTPSVTSAA
jgi:hypothetical protein